jgi:hypothetical protein
MEEEFRAILNYPNYEVSNLGRVRNITSGKMLRGTLCGGYHRVQLNKKFLFVHRLVLTTFVDNTEAKACVDHINNVKNDNRLENLRYATHVENSRNARLSSKNTSGYKGVSYHKPQQMWQAHIRIDGILITIGYYKTAEEAAEARRIRANEVFGNFINAVENRVVTP